MREPRFWWREKGWAARLLTPLAAIYGAVAAARLRRPGARSAVPVICVGNFHMGGAGKTPVALALEAHLAARGHRVVFLTRGHGGREAGPLLVVPGQHDAADVGDEALLLARHALTVVARDRAAGAQLAERSGASLIVMDDGFQNPTLEKDFSLIVVDAARGFGNGCVCPAGPLRAPLRAQAARADAYVLVGAGDASVPAGKPVYRAHLEPDAAALAALKRRPVLAFAGIGHPERFFAMLRDAGVEVARARAFPDHHAFDEDEIIRLVAAAEAKGWALVTTEKDYVRLARWPHLAARIAVLPVTMRLETDAAFAAVEAMLAARRG